MEGIVCGFLAAYGRGDIDTNIEMFAYSTVLPMIATLQIILFGHIDSRKQELEEMASVYTGSVLGMSLYHHMF